MDETQAQRELRLGQEALALLRRIYDKTSEHPLSDRWAPEFVRMRAILEAQGAVEQ